MREGREREGEGGERETEREREWKGVSFLDSLTSFLASSNNSPPPPEKTGTAQLDDFKRLKDEFPDRVLIASIMEEYSEERWLELVERVEGAGVDAIEINFSCPHGMPGEFFSFFLLGKV